MKKLFAGRLLAGQLALMLGVSGVGQAQLTLTEVDFATNTIEITNVSASTFSGTRLEWCVPFEYGTMHAASFSFAAGEVRTYVISKNISATVGDDLWIYLNNSGFNTESQVTTGVIWGSVQQGNGRTNAVVAESDAWDVVTDFVQTITPAIPAGHTMQLKAGSPSSATSASWEIAAANLGTYQLTVTPSELELGIKKGLAAGEVILFWPTTTSAGAVLKKSATLQEVMWPAEGSVPTVVGDNNEVTVTVSGAEYFRLELP
ncbi:MAG: hypothetical protein O3A87_10835 [Verrucomicrobia bacterium]|nr:hypothetical protein [Verrucomicrobiota bacterium]